MNQNERLLTFEIGRDGELEISGNVEGLRNLVKRLGRVADTGGHDHLMTSSWGGNELTEEPQREGSKLVNKVTIRSCGSAE